MIQQEEMLQIGISEQRQEIDKIYSLGMKVVVFLILFTELRSVSNFSLNFLQSVLTRKACFGHILL